MNKLEHYLNEGKETITVDFDYSADQDYIYKKYKMKLTKKYLENGQEANDAELTGDKKDLLAYMRDEYFHDKKPVEFNKIIKSNWPDFTDTD